MTGLPLEQVAVLVDLVGEYVGGWQSVCWRRHEMELFDAVLTVLFYYRHNCSQEVTGGLRDERGGVEPGCVAQGGDDALVDAAGA